MVNSCSEIDCDFIQPMVVYEVIMRLIVSLTSQGSTVVERERERDCKFFKLMVNCLTDQQWAVVKRLMVRFTWPMINSLVILIVS